MLDSSCPETLINFIPQTECTNWYLILLAALLPYKEEGVRSSTYNKARCLQRQVFWTVFALLWECGKYRESHWRACQWAWTFNPFVSALGVLLLQNFFFRGLQFHTGMRPKTQDRQIPLLVPKLYLGFPEDSGGVG